MLVMQKVSSYELLMLRVYQSSVRPMLIFGYYNDWLVELVRPIYGLGELLVLCPFNVV